MPTITFLARMEVKKHEQTINIARSYPDFHCYIFHIGYINVVTINLGEYRGIGKIS